MGLDLVISGRLLRFGEAQDEWVFAAVAQQSRHARDQKEKNSNQGDQGRKDCRTQGWGEKKWEWSDQFKVSTLLSILIAYTQGSLIPLP